MNPFELLLSRLFPNRAGRTRYAQDSQQIQHLVSELARQERLPIEQVREGLLAEALARRTRQQELLHAWYRLSPREQQVAALACYGHTNDEIALQLGVAPSTIKTHLRNLLYKFNLHSKAALRVALAEWDLSDFLPGAKRR